LQEIIKRWYATQQMGMGTFKDVTQLQVFLERSGTMLIRAQRISIHIM
jgi:hypothetical protein